MKGISIRFVREYDIVADKQPPRIDVEMVEGRMNTPREPTADECTANAQIEPGAFAIWYPQMGGYAGKAVFYPGEQGEDGCVEIYVWHDGEFPFGGDRGFENDAKEPVNLHHCSAEQFVRFGQTVLEIQKRTGKRTP